MKLKIALGLACAVIVWLGITLVRVENERHALYIGMCRDKLGLTDAACLARVQTRTAWGWHLYYALID